LCTVLVDNVSRAVGSTAKAVIRRSNLYEKNVP
jgi:hypothetical protein